MSPEVGTIDEAALESLLADDPDEALTLVAAMTGATDERLRRLARQIAGRVVLRFVDRGRPDSRGVGRLVGAPLAPGRDVDVDASVDELVAARAHDRSPDVDELRATAWARPSTAICLLIDRSGSMGGDRLATAALAAAAASFRAEGDFSVVAFSGDAIVIKAQDEDRDVTAVVDDVLALRGHGSTDLASALAEAATQLARSNAKRSVTVLLSDCRATAGGDPVRAARRLDTLAVVAPAGDDDDARSFAAAVGARLASVGGPSDVPRAFLSLST